MEGIYFAQGKMNHGQNSGPINKINDQLQAFRKAGFEIDFINFPPVESGFRKTFFGKGILASLPFFAVFSYYKYKKEFDGKDFYYIRFEAADFSFRRFLRKLRQNNPNAKIIIEFPDFPNTIWMRSIFHIGIYLKDLYARRFYKKYIDRFAVWNKKYTEIYGVKTIYYTNGIDVSRIPIKKIAESNNKTEINVLALGSMFPFHGFDRFIKGMKSYYENHSEKKVMLHVVGNDIGGERKKYEDYVVQNNLSAYVKFYAGKEGDELTSFCNTCDIGLGSLGMYRIGFDVASSLKTREYFARGFPVVAGCPIDVVQGKGVPFVIEFPNDDTAIDIEKVVQWYDGLCKNSAIENVPKLIREFALQHCDVSISMKEIVTYIKK